MLGKMVVVGRQGLKDYNGLARTHHDTFFYCRKSRDYQGARKKTEKTGDFQGGKEKGGKNWRFSGGSTGLSGEIQGKSRGKQVKARESRGKPGKAGDYQGGLSPVSHYPTHF